METGLQTGAEAPLPDHDDLTRTHVTQGKLSFVVAAGQSPARSGGTACEFAPDDSRALRESIQLQGG